MRTKVESKEGITGISEKIDDLREEYRARANDAGWNFGNAIWKTIVGSLGIVAPIWYIFASEAEQKYSGNTGWALLLSFGVGTFASTGAVVDIFEGIAHLRIKNDILEEISSLRSVLTRRYNAVTNGNSLE